MPSRFNAPCTAEGTQATPAASASSARVASSWSARAARSRSAASPAKAGGPPPPCGRGAIEPASRRRFSGSRAHETLTEKRAATYRRVPSQAATTRSRKSIE